MSKSDDDNLVEGDQRMPTKPKFEKVECPICKKKVDPRGLGAHQKAHRDPNGAPYIKGAPEEVIMVPVNKSFLLKLMAKWMSDGSKE